MLITYAQMQTLLAQQMRSQFGVNVSRKERVMNVAVRK